MVFDLSLYNMFSFLDKPIGNCNWRAPGTDTDVSLKSSLRGYEKKRKDESAVELGLDNEWWTIYYLVEENYSSGR